MFDFANPMSLLFLAGGFILVVLIFRADTKVEGLRSAAIELSQECDKLGLTFCTGFLHKFAIGDKSGMISSVVQGVNAMRDHDTRFDVYRRVFKAVTRTLWERDPEAREGIRNYLTDLEAEQAVRDNTKVVRPKVQVTAPPVGDDQEEVE